MTTPKAMLINTAKQYSWTNPAYNPSLDRNKQGWGLPNIAAVYDLRQKMVIVNETDAITQFQSVVYNVVVNEGEQALKATLVYADPPGAPSSSRHSINDLTLKVTAPNGTTHYWGNCGLRDGSDPLWSSPDCTLGDHPYLGDPTIEVIDTVENVFVQNPPQGLWQIRVRADEINQDGHTETPAGEGCIIAPFCDVDFALVVSGARRDCNTNGIPDEQDIASGTSQDCNGNGVPDECESIIGACCIGGTCSVVAQGCCSSQGGVFIGEGVTCEVCDVCGEEGLRACCPPWGDCILWTAECCSAVGGQFYPHTFNCTGVYCAFLAPGPGP